LGGELGRRHNRTPEVVIDRDVTFRNCLYHFEELDVAVLSILLTYLTAFFVWAPGVSDQAFNQVS
jgi:hypothetical protein